MAPGYGGACHQRLGHVWRAWAGDLVRRSCGHGKLAGQEMKCTCTTPILLPWNYVPFALHVVGGNQAPRCDAQPCSLLARCLLWVPTGRLSGACRSSHVWTSGRQNTC